MKNILAFPRRRTGVDFDALIRPHLDILYRTAFRFCRQRHDAEDLVQDLLIKLYPRREELARIDKLRPWLITSLYHLFIDGTRKSKRSPLQAIEDEQGFYDSMPSDLPGPEGQLLREQRLRAIQRAYERLSDEHRALISLHDIEGYRLPELQEMLGLPLGTLKSRIHRARARLREMLREDLGADDSVPGNLFQPRGVNRARGSRA